MRQLQHTGPCIGRQCGETLQFILRQALKLLLVATTPATNEGGSRTKPFTSTQGSSAHPPSKVFLGVSPRNTRGLRPFEPWRLETFVAHEAVQGASRALYYPGFA